MTERNKYLILFFEENEDNHVKDSNMMRVYMNRFTIEEEGRYEIIGFDFLQTTTADDRRPELRIPDAMNDDDIPDLAVYQDYEYCLRRPKLFNDVDIKYRTIQKSKESISPNSDLYIFIGSTFHQNNFTGLDLVSKMTTVPFVKKLYKLMMAVYEDLGLSVSLTFLSSYLEGFRIRIERPKSELENHQSQSSLASQWVTQTTSSTDDCDLFYNRTLWMGSSEKEYSRREFQMNRDFLKLDEDEIEGEQLYQKYPRLRMSCDLHDRKYLLVYSHRATVCFQP